MITPDDALEKAKEIVKRHAPANDPNDYDPAKTHQDLDDLLCQILREHSYGKLVDFYQDTTRWFE